MYIMWIVIGAVVIIIAIIGYVADHTKNGNKEKATIQEVKIDKIENSDKDSAWSNNTPPKDEKQETEYKVPSVDDWSKIPTTEDKIDGEKLETPVENPIENQSEIMFDDLGNNQSEIKEMPIETINTPKPLPAEPTNVNPTVLPATPSVPTPSMISTENQPLENTPTNLDTSLEQIPAQQNLNNQETIAEEKTSIENSTEPITEQITEPINAENIWS